MSPSLMLSLIEPFVPWLDLVERVLAAPYLMEAVASSCSEPQEETSLGNRMGTVTDLVVNFGVGVWEGVRILGLEVSVSGRLQEVCDT
jgi:hypothetical protein